MDLPWNSLKNDTGMSVLSCLSNLNISPCSSFSLIVSFDFDFVDLPCFIFIWDFSSSGQDASVRVEEEPGESNLNLVLLGKEDMAVSLNRDIRVSIVF